MSQEGCEVDVDSIYQTKITCTPFFPSIPGELVGEWGDQGTYMQWPGELAPGEPSKIPSETRVYAREQDGRTGLGVIPTIRRIGDILSQHEGNRFAEDNKTYTVQDLEPYPVQKETAATHLYEQICKSLLKGRNRYSTQLRSGTLQGMESFLFVFDRQPTQIPAGSRRVHLPENRASFSWCTKDKPTAATPQTSSRARYSMPIPPQPSQSNATRELPCGDTREEGSPSQPATGSVYSGENEMPGAPMASFDRSNASSPDSPDDGNRVSPEDPWSEVLIDGYDHTVIKTGIGRRGPLGKVRYKDSPWWTASPYVPPQSSQVYVSREEDKSARLGIMPNPEAISDTLKSVLSQTYQNDSTSRVFLDTDDIERNPLTVDEAAAKWCRRIDETTRDGQAECKMELYSRAFLNDIESVKLHFVRSSMSNSPTARIKIKNDRSTFVVSEPERRTPNTPTVTSPSLDRNFQVNGITQDSDTGARTSYLAPKLITTPTMCTSSGPLRSNVTLPPRPRVVQPSRIPGRRPGRPRHDTEGNTSTVTQSDNPQGSGTGLDPGYPWADEEILRLNFWDGPDDFLV